MSTLRSFAALALSTLLAAPLAAQGSADEMRLTDQPGNWFRSEDSGTPVSIVPAGSRVDFVINNCCTTTRHTVTLLVKPVGSQTQIDQDSSQNGTLSATFDLPGVYVLVCKVHPYMTAVVAATGPGGTIPPVSAASLPFLQHLGVASLPATDVLAVVTTVAANDADKSAKWDLRDLSDQFLPAIPGVGEVWINTQFERVPGQTDDHGVPKPGTITVLDAGSMQIEREINGLGAEDHMWNNPHNMWADVTLSTIYNTNWFGRWLNRIDRASGQITDSISVGEAPTHVITVPSGDQFGWLLIPLSAEDSIVKVVDGGADGLHIEDEADTGDGKTHPHGHWLSCGEGDRTIVPNVFKGLGFEGSISIMDTLSGEVLVEFEHDAGDPLASALLMPIAAGECHVQEVSTAFVANAASGFVTVVDVDALELVANIAVTLTPDGDRGLDILNTLQVPIQTPVSPDERWVATAVLGLTTVPTTLGAPDHVAIIDTQTREVVKFLPTPGGTHGANWGAKLGGGYYVYVTSQHANVLTVIDPDPNFDGNGSDAAVVGSILLDNASFGAGVTDGTGGQGIKPIPLTHDGWIQDTAALSGSGALSPEVESWIAQLTPEQLDPHGGQLEPIHLASDQLVEGQPASITIVGTQAGQVIRLVVGLGGIGDGPCFGALGGQCLGVLPQLVLLPPVVTGPNGMAKINFTVPSNLPPITIALQAVVVAGGNSLLSNAVSLPVQ